MGYDRVYSSHNIMNDQTHYQTISKSAPHQYAGATDKNTSTHHSCTACDGEAAPATQLPGHPALKYISMAAV